MVEFAPAAAGILGDLRDRVGLETWLVLRRTGADGEVLCALDDILGFFTGQLRPWGGLFCAGMADASGGRVVPDSGAEPASGVSRELAMQGVAACVTVPIRSPEGVLLGVLCGAGRRPRPGLEQTMPMVQLQADVLGALLGYDLWITAEGHRAQEAELLADTDPLTGVRNRRGWEAALAAAETGGPDATNPATVVVVNLDGLLEANATAGHPAGDRLQVGAAAVLTAGVRRRDLLARLDAGRFAVLLPSTDLAAARALTGRLARALRGAGVAVTIGMGACRPSAGVRQAWQDADQALYRAGQPPGGEPEPQPEPAVPALPAMAPAPRPAASPPGVASDGLGGVDALLELARAQLGMDVAFVGEFRGEDRIVRNAASSVELPVGVGFRQPRAETHCQLLVDGRIPEVLPDTSVDAAFAALPITDALSMRSYLGVPLRRGSGELYGTLCAFAQHAEPTLRARDAGVLRVLGGMVMHLVEQDERAGSAHRETLARLQQLYAGGGPTPVYQPVLTLDGGRQVGVEALSRFPEGTPDQWFPAATAAGVDIGVELEFKAAANAAVALPDLDGFLAINLSPAALLHPDLELLAPLPLPRIVIEVTEHHPVDDYLELTAILAPLRARGLRIAVDDAGAGFASMRHITRLLPDLIKLDISLVRNINTDPAAQALTRALLAFAASANAQVLAEGIETTAELACLRRLGVPLGQGYLLARPSPAAAPKRTPAKQPAGTPRPRRPAEDHKPRAAPDAA